MATGFLAQGICFATQADAGAYVCSKVWPVSVINSQNQPVTTICQGWVNTTGGRYTLNTMVAGAAGTGSNTPSYFGTCDTTDYLQYNPWGMSAADGALVGGAVVGVWCAAWAWKALQRALRSDVVQEES